MSKELVTLLILIVTAGVLYALEHDAKDED